MEDLIQSLVYKIKDAYDTQDREKIKSVLNTIHYLNQENLLLKGLDILKKNGIELIEDEIKEDDNPLTQITIVHCLKYKDQAFEIQ